MNKIIDAAARSNDYPMMEKPLTCIEFRKRFEMNSIMGNECFTMEYGVRKLLVVRRAQPVCFVRSLD